MPRGVDVLPDQPRVLLPLRTPRLCLGDRPRALGASTQPGLLRTLDTVFKGLERETR